MDVLDLGLSELLEILRAEGSDVTHIEAKRAHSYPETVAQTLSAFSNTPGGGVLLLGVDEANGFAAVGVRDAVDFQKRVANQARQALDPPISPTISHEAVEGRHVVVVRVPELQPSHKPCRITATGAGYLRSYDGDFRLSPQEEQSFIANRGTPAFDREPVPGTSPGDLDPGLLDSYLASCRARSDRLAASDPDTVLLRTSVIDPQGRLTLAGLYALGAYPQQFFPSLAVVARAMPMANDPPGTRTGDLGAFDGPLPEMLERAMAWVRRNTATRVRFGPDGHALDEPTYPPEAVRELVANALVHRDLGPHSRGESVNIALEPRKLVVSNPGGLWGLTVEQLGRTSGGISRNQALYAICRDVRTPGGRRVIEGIGSGIEAIRGSLRAAGMSPPSFSDTGIRFTAFVPNHALLGGEDLQWLAGLPNTEGLGDVPRHVLATMRGGAEWSNKSLRDVFPMDSTEARSIFVDLVARGLVVRVGDGRGTAYRLATEQPQAAAVPSRRTRIRPEDLLRVFVPGQPRRVADIVEATGYTPRQVRLGLSRLVEQGSVSVSGSRGRRGLLYVVVEDAGTGQEGVTGDR